MARNLEMNESSNNANVANTSFNGGVARGTCLQMTQMHFDKHELQNVQLTREQVVKQMAVMAEWLGE